MMNLPANEQPTVSIGLAVFNGASFVGEAIESILDQTWQDLELIISDNASVDDSFSICTEYARHDDRIRLYRNELNVGAAPNFNRMFHLARGKYFKWAFHDDVLLPRFLEATVAVLDADPSVVTCMTRAVRVDERRVRIGESVTDALWESDNASERLVGILRELKRMAIHGVSRVSSLERTALHGSYADSDVNLLAELALLGRIVVVDEELYQIRIHSEKSTVKFKDPRERQEFFNTDRLRRATTPTITSIVDHLRAIARHEKHLPLRLRYARIVLFWYLANRPRAVLGDLRVIAYRFLGRSGGRSKPVSA